MNSFTYVISSDDRINSIGVETSFYDIPFGGFSNEQNYHVEFVNCTINGGAVGGFVVLCAANLAEDGYYCSAKLPSNEAVICSIPLGNLLYADRGSSFSVKNCNVKKIVRFRFRRADLSPAETDIDINNGVETRFLLTLKITPL
jgi:hypothetical protein